MPEEGKPAEESRRDVIRVSSQFLGFGMAFAASVALFGWIGFKVGTFIEAESPLTILGALFGGTVGFYSLYAHVVIRSREEQGHEEGDKD